MGKLLVVGTPIGNLNDLSPRGVRALTDCDFIAAEDTRVTLKILNHFGIKKPMVSYYEHNRRERGEEILKRIIRGETCALVTDAGMPAISDPGEDLVRLCHENSIKVEAVPGPCAFVTALAISGMPSGRFTFEGFLSTNKLSRREHLNSLVNEKRTMIFYEAPHKLLRTLADLLETLGDRELALCRELTKLHEEVIHTTLAQAPARFRENPPRGEFVLVVSGAPEPTGPGMTEEAALELVRRKMRAGLSRKDACKAAAEASGLPRRTLYERSLEDG